MFAIRSAGITFAITKACADGLIRNCGCQSHCSTISTVRPELPIQSQSPSASIDAFASSSSFSFSSSSSPSLSPSPTAVHSAKPESSWPSIGCSDNIEYASSQTKQLLDVRLKSEPTDLSTVLMTHNYNAGRQVSHIFKSIRGSFDKVINFYKFTFQKAVVQNMRTVCKCHGISGSCSVRSCWRRLSSFRQIGDWLKTRYDEAIRVQPANDGINYTAIEHQDSNSRSSPWPQSADIVFADTSPNFCLPDPRIGSVGTRTRRCKPNSSQPDNCDLLCCGRGYETVQHTQRYNCRCQFQWCCDVQCDQCERQVDVHICR